MNKKILIIGGVAGGASVAARARRLDESAEIIIFEKGAHVSFSTCSIPYYLSGIVKEHEDLMLMKPQQFYDEYRIDTRVYNEVTKINRLEKKVEVRNVVTGEVTIESYDKLVVATGGRPIMPIIPGMADGNIFTIKNVVDIARFKNFIEEADVEDISIIGGGFIGVELAENLRIAGYNVSIIEAKDQLIESFDYDLIQILHKELYDNGIDLILEDEVKEFKEGQVILKSGRSLKSDVSLIAMGISPETSLAIDGGLDLGKSGAIRVNSNYLTSDRDIYAIGDVTEVYNPIIRDYMQVSMAGPAQKQGRDVANHIYGMEVKNTGVIGSGVFKAFDYKGASVGLNEKLIRDYDLNLNYDYVYIVPDDKVRVMPDNEVMFIKVLFELPTGKLLGAQAIGKGNIDKRIDVIGTVIKFSGDLDDLADLDLCYSPPFSTAKDAVNYSGLVGKNILNNKYKEVRVSKARDLVETGELIIDVREEEEYESGHLINSINIPLGRLRTSLDLIPKDRPVYFHCRTGQRAYNAIITLQNLGYDKVYNIEGSFLGICFYEYFNDKIKNRKPIVTNYNFGDEKK